jgi:hypothetical protein
MLLLARAHTLGRAILTHNRRHFERMHRQGILHSGILSATRDSDSSALAVRIDVALASLYLFSASTEVGPFSSAGVGQLRPAPRL